MIPRSEPVPTMALIPPPTTLVALSRAHAARIAADGRRISARRRRGLRFEHPPSPNRAAYLRLPETALLDDRAIRKDVTDLYAATGSLALVKALLVDRADRITRRRAALTAREVELLAEWRTVAVADALADVVEAAEAGLLRHRPKPPPAAHEEGTANDAG